MWYVIDAIKTAVYCLERCVDYDRRYVEGLVALVRYTDRVCVNTQVGSSKW